MNKRGTCFCGSNSQILHSFVIQQISHSKIIFRPVYIRISSTIYLVENYYPKLSDCGLTKLGLLDDKNHISTRVMGTYGYRSCEYVMT